MRKHKDTDSELSSIISLNDEEQTNLSSYMSSSKHEKQASINVQSEEKAKAQESYAKMEKLMKKIRNEYKYDKVCNFKSIERTPFLELDRSKRDSTTIQLLDSSTVRNEEDAKKSFEQIINCLYKNKLVQETIKYK